MDCINQTGHSCKAGNCECDTMKIPKTKARDYREEADREIKHWEKCMADEDYFRLITKNQSPPINKEKFYRERLLETLIQLKHLENESIENNL